MEITKENIGQAISALRKCAEEHKKDVTPTFGIVVSSLCNDVADYLEKIKGLALIEMPSEEEIETEVYELAKKITRGGHDRLYAANGQGKILDNVTYEEICDYLKEMVDWLKSKIVK